MVESEVDGVEKSIGAFGRWHFYICALMYLMKVPSAWHQLMIVMIAPPAEDFTCIDKTNACDKDCSKHVFDRSVFTDTIIMTWDLVCKKKIMPNIIQSIIMVGVLLGNVVCGYIADRFGRKYILIYATILQVLSGCAAAFVPWLWGFIALKFVNAFATGGTAISSYVLIMEIIGIRWRTIVGVLYHIPFAVGHLSLAVIGYFIRDWHYIQWVCSVSGFLLVIFLWTIPESPRWLLSVGKRDTAIQVLTKAAKCNRLPTDNIIKNVDEYMAQRELRMAKGGNVKDLCRSKASYTKFIFTIMNWFNFGLCFFGISQFVGHLKGNIFVNVLISGSCGIPGICFAVLLLQKIGRKPTLLVGNIFTTAGMFAMVPFVDYEWIAPALIAISIFGMAISFVTVYIYAGELFPTVIRNLSIGIASMVSKFGSILAPHLFVLEDIFGKWITPLIFASLCFVGLIVSLWLPETKDCILPDTVAESEKFKITLKFKRADQLNE